MKQPTVLPVRSQHTSVSSTGYVQHFSLRQLIFVSIHIWPYTRALKVTRLADVCRPKEEKFTGNWSSPFNAMNVRASPFAVEIMNNVLNNSAIVVVADGRKTCASRVARMYWAVRTVLCGGKCMKITIYASVLKTILMVIYIYSRWTAQIQITHGRTSQRYEHNRGKKMGWRKIGFNLVVCSLHTFHRRLIYFFLSSKNIPNWLHTIAHSILHIGISLSLV